MKAQLAPDAGKPYRRLTTKQSEDFISRLTKFGYEGVMARRFLFSLISTALLGLLCQPVLGLAEGIDRPPVQMDDGWQVAFPSEAGFDPVALAAIARSVEVGRIPNVHTILIEHDGRLVYEHYFNGQDEILGSPIGSIDFDHTILHDLRSVTKSLTSALLGIALGDDAGNFLEQPITSFFPDVASKFGTGAEAVTLHHVLTMTAGLEWKEMEVPYTFSRNDEIRLYSTDDPVGMVLSRPVIQPPGDSWYYNGGLTQVVAGLIERRIGKPIDKFAKDVLFGPLGITEYDWLRSPIWSENTSPSAAAGLRLRPRDLAKIASLFLHDGVWNRQQIIPAAWIHKATERYVQDVPWGPPGVYGYGYFWYPGEFRGLHEFRVIRAVGNGDQRLFIVPEYRVVVTVFAGNYDDFNHDSGDRVFGAVMAARNAP